MLGDREGAYPPRSVTERSTKQVAHSLSYPLGERISAPVHRRGVGHDAPRHRSLLASRFDAEMRLAIDTVNSWGAP